MRLVDYNDIPVRLRHRTDEVLPPRHLVHFGHEKRVRVRPSVLMDHRRIEHIEAEPELLLQFGAPLIHQPTRRDDERALESRAQKQLLEIEARHDGFARAGVVREEEPQRDTRQQLAIDCTNLVGQGIHRGGVDGGHGVVEPRIVNTQRLRRQTEIRGIGGESGNEPFHHKLKRFS